MVELTNSQRMLYKATYVPTRTNRLSPQPPLSGVAETPQPARALEKVAFLRWLDLKPGELDRLGNDTAVQALVAKPSAVVAVADAKPTPQPLLEVARALSGGPSPEANARFGPLLMEVTPEDLETFGRAVVRERRRVAETLRGHAAELRRRHAEAAPGAAATSVELARWGLANEVPAARELQTLAAAAGVAGTAPEAAVARALDHLVDAAARHAEGTESLVDGTLERFRIEPVGRIHLERLEMTPIGIEHGELLYTVPLTPKETVNISHREWSSTTQTFENIVEDFFEGFSEQGVAEKTDLTNAVSNESRHASSLDLNGNVSTSYQSGGGFSVTASAGVDFNTTSEDSRAVKDSTSHSLAITRTASSRVRKEHKVSFRVSSVAGAEDLAVRVLTNPTENAMRVDYFRLMRKWRVRLIRYGLRMTYDIVVPNPGGDLAAKVFELHQLEGLLQNEPVFTVTLADITPTSWDDLAQRFGTTVEPPPQAAVEFMRSLVLQKSIDVFTFATLDFDIPDGYQVASGNFECQVHLDGGNYGSGHRMLLTLWNEHSVEFPQADGGFAVNLTTNGIVGHTGHVIQMIKYFNIDTGSCLAKVVAEPSSEALDGWRLRVWNQLREAALAAHMAAQQRLRDRIAALEAELGAFDALTLRRMEREEIMRAVLQWLLGPSFAVRPGSLDDLLEKPDESVFDSGSVANWQKVMQFGEFIKYIHNAIEWENVVFFAYPYFWDATKRWPFKRFLIHPNLEHRAFLRAGCARVVLTIRPGFEESFARLIETGSLGVVLAGNHPYVTIGEEIRNFAMTNYEAIPPANPDVEARPLLQPEQRAAWRDLQRIMLALEEHSDRAHAADPSLPPEVKAYPTTAQGLAALKLPPGVSRTDPWGRPFVYVSPGLRGDYDLASYGKNGQPGGEGLDADITSWAAGSIVAEWNEYTPTSALDVKVDTSLGTSALPA